ncbi:MAG: nuclear transport factor 2 family protein [Pseudomonadota bacterium]
MNNPQSEKCVRTFINSYYSGDVARMEQCCDDAFVSVTYAPVEIFPHLGLKQSKAWIAQAIQIQQERYSDRRCTIDFVIADETQAATFVQATLTKRSDQRVITLNVGEFFTLRNGRIVEHRSLFDSFDLVQQLLGRDLTDEFAARLKHAMRQ